MRRNDLERAVTCILNCRASQEAAEGQEAIERIAAELGRGVRVVVCGGGEDLGALARQARETGGLVAVGGGDGTVSAVAAALVDGSVPLGVLPMGTLNHFAKDLGIPLDLEGAVRDAVHRDRGAGRRGRGQRARLPEQLERRPVPANGPRARTGAAARAEQMGRVRPCDRARPAPRRHPARRSSGRPRGAPSARHHSCSSAITRTRSPGLRSASAPGWIAGRFGSARRRGPTA